MSSEPIRATVHLTLADSDGSAADRVLALSDVLEGFGMTLECATIEHMAEGDVVRGSPLEQRLSA